MPLSPKHATTHKVLLGLTGGIACYKAAELVRLLIKSGAQVQVMMSEAACQFITPVTMQALSGQPVITSQWDARPENNMAHINLGRDADCIVIAPASADFIAKLAQGRADELLSLTCLARPAGTPLLLAPAMNREMWLHPATQRNVQQVLADGAQNLGVGCGEQACGEFGDGRMLEAEEIYADIVASLTPKILASKKVLITAGPTYEAIDPVRGITNRSSGKMGYALAQAAREAGAEVTLVSGPTALPTPRGVRRVDVRAAQEMLTACEAEAAEADIFIAVAAVADWRVANAATQKIKKQADIGLPHLELIENPDILATIAQSARAKSGALYCVGFAAESENLQENASAKRLRKGVPLLVGNIGPDTFGQDENALLLIDAEGSHAIPRASKRELAQQLLTEINKRL